MTQRIKEIIKVDSEEIKSMIRGVDPLKSNQNVLSNPFSIERIREMGRQKLLFQSQRGDLFYIKDYSKFKESKIDIDGCDLSTVRLKECGTKALLPKGNVLLTGEQSASLKRLTLEQKKRFVILINYLNEARTVELMPDGDTEGMKKVIEDVLEDKPIAFYYFAQSIGNLAALDNGHSRGIPDLGSQLLFGKLGKGGDVTIMDEYSFLDPNINTLIRKKGREYLILDLDGKMVTISKRWVSNEEYKGRVIELVDGCTKIEFKDAQLDGDKARTAFEMILEHILRKNMADLPVLMNYKSNLTALRSSGGSIMGDELTVAVVTAAGSAKAKPDALYVSVTEKRDGKLAIAWKTTLPNHGVFTIIALDPVYSGIVREKNLADALSKNRENGLGVELHLITDKKDKFLAYLITPTGTTITEEKCIGYVSDSVEMFLGRSANANGPHIFSDKNFSDHEGNYINSLLRQ